VANDSKPLVDRLEERGWPHEDTCSFCDQEIETANPLFIGCFATELWAGFASTHPTAAQAASRSTAINCWWRKILRFRKSKARREQTLPWHMECGTSGSKGTAEFLKTCLQNLTNSFQVRDGVASLRAAF
jgi:hypothetical protein